MAKEVEESFFKKVISYLPILSIVISISAYIKNTIYYYSFNVSIKYYTSITELGILIFNDLLILIPLCLLGASIIFVFLKEVQKFRWSNDSVTEKPSKLDKVFNRYPNFFGFLIFVILGFITSLFVNLDRGIGPSFPLWERMLNYSILLIFLLNGYVANYIRKDEKNPLTYQFILILTMLFLPVNFLVVISTDIRDTRSGKFKGTVIQTADTTFISNDASYFIGKTEKYVFIHNQHDTTNWIIPTESIKRILIKEK